MDTYSIPGNTICSVLDAVARVSGPQYRALLTAAGWQHWLTTPPPATWAPVARPADLSRLFSAVYRMLGEDLTRLFFTNYGNAMAEQLLAAEAGTELRQALARAPQPASLAEFLPVFTRVQAQGWGHATLHETPQAWLMTMDYCPVCSEISGARAPLCTSGTALMGQMARQIMGRRVRVAEVACVATGDPHCVYAFYKS